MSSMRKRALTAALNVNAPGQKVNVTASSGGDGGIGKILGGTKAGAGATVFDTQELRTHVLTKQLCGKMKTVAIAQNTTIHLTVELEAECYSVNIGIPNMHTAAIPGVVVTAAQASAFPTALGDNGLITPQSGYNWRPTVTLTLDAKDTNGPSYTWTGDIRVQSTRRADGGRPVVLIRIEYPAAAGYITVPQNGTNLANWFSGATTEGRRIFGASQAVLGATTPTSFTNVSTIEETNIVLPAIKYVSRKPGRAVFVSGDSTTEGITTPTMFMSPSLIAAYKLSTPDNPIEVFCGAMHSTTSSAYRPRLDYLLPMVPATHIIYQPYSINGVNPGGMTDDRGKDQFRQDMALAIGAIEKYRAKGLLIEGLPCDPGFKDVNANDSRRIEFNAEIRAQACANIATTNGYADAISGPVDADGQTTIAAGLSPDYVHPSRTGNDLLYPWISAWLNNF